MPKPSLKRLVQVLHQAVQWARERLEGHPSDLTGWRRLLINNLRVLVLVLRVEVYQRIRLHAEALTVATLLAVVPTVAVALAIVKIVGGMHSIYAELEEILLSNISGTEEIRVTVIHYLRQFIDNIQTGQLGALSILILVYSVVMLLGHIERSFNVIFGAERRRPVGLRLLIYWAVITLGPLLLGGSLALTAYLHSTAVAALLARFSGLGAILLKAAPLVVTWVGFSLMYWIVPATRVRLRAAVFAALIAGSLWNIAKFGFSYYAHHAVTVHDIYGSLATVPMFIIWIYVSWVLVLLGAQLAFAFQNAATYRLEQQGARPSFSALELATCRVFLEIARDFFKQRRPTTHDGIAETLQMPRRLLETVVTHLRTGGFVRETDDGGLVPAGDLEQVSVDDILVFLRDRAGTQPHLVDDPPRRYLAELALAVAEERHRLAGPVTFRDLAARFDGPAESALSNEPPQPAELH